MYTVLLAILPYIASVLHLRVQMSRYSSISLRAASGTVSRLAMTFTLIMWGGDMMFWDENVQIWRTSPSGHLAGHKGCCLVTICVILAHFCWIGNHLQLSYVFWEFCCFCWFAECSINVFNSFSCCVCGSGPTFGANIMFFTTHLWPLPVQTQGMQLLLKLFIQIY